MWLSAAMGSKRSMMTVATPSRHMRMRNVIGAE